MLDGIFTAPGARAPMVSLDSALAVPGRGLEGDRYFNKQGTFWKERPDFQVTFIEAEAIEALKRDYGLALAPQNARRNLLTRGVALNHLVGREFFLGEVRFRGIRLCEPCAHLQELTGLDVIRGLRHRGGLRAEVLSEGPLRVGDSFRVNN